VKVNLRVNLKLSVKILISLVRFLCFVYFVYYLLHLVSLVWLKPICFHLHLVVRAILGLANTKILAANLILRFKGLGFWGY
jgi:hypothetical protein